jgi:hypothetical protein
LGSEAAPGLAGNISGASMVNNLGTNYIYCSDEGFHDGIHRWRMDGAVNEISCVVNTASDGWYNMSAPLAWPATNLVLNPGFESEVLC